MSELLREITERRSGRAFEKRPLDDEFIQLILEAGRLAPSCANTQAWNFVVLKDLTVLTEAHVALSRGNAWGKEAPLMIIVTAKEDGGCSAHGLPYFMMDVGLAVENMLLQAVHLGIMGHPTAGWDEAKLKTQLKIPEDHRIVTVIFFGYPLSREEVPPEQREKEFHPKERRPLSEIVHWDMW
ncbi:MAG: nitroreductase family protein [Candidatus Thorarchaeota archaeon]|nr:nitroreductase family protein [Candidatus Thorarchaeota archaeon]